MVFAEEKQSDYELFVTPSFGMLYGQAKEIVYKDSVSSNFLSELQWDIMPLFYVGMAADIGPTNNFAKHGFIGTFSFKMGIPQKTGIMVDRDWENKYWLSSGTLTNYSRHNNFSEKAILADLSIGYSFPLFDFTAFGINIDFSYMHYNWIAKDGYYQYLDKGQTWDDEIPKVPLNGKVIEYTQNWFILSPGVFVKFRLGRFFSVNGNFKYSPLVYCTDEDNHLLRDTIFQDYLFYGQYLKGSGGITILPMNNLELTFFLSYSSITNSRGDSFFNSVNHTGIAGGGYSVFEFGLSARLRLSGSR
jgi:outer membrane protease